MVSRILRLSRLLALLSSCAAAAAQSAVLPVSLTADQVMVRVQAMNQSRAEQLQSYSGVRTYRLQMHGLISKRAEMVIRVDYRAPGTKKFAVLSESGPGVVRNRVFRRLLQAELDSMSPQGQQESAISLENYRFQLVGHYRTKSGEFYVLKAEPKTKGEFLFAGRIWVNAADFAVTKIDGQPAANPSWWTKSTDFDRIYEHVGQFWLPKLNRSVTQVRIFGTAVLTIAYRDYQITPSQRVGAALNQSTSAPTIALCGAAIPHAAIEPYKTLMPEPSSWTMPEGARFEEAAWAPHCSFPSPTGQSRASAFLRILSPLPSPRAFRFEGQAR
jgi:hypothetical protein